MTVARRTWSFDNGDGVSWIAAPTYDEALMQARLRGWRPNPGTGPSMPKLNEEQTAAIDVMGLIDVVFP